MATYTIRSHNRIETADNLDAAKAIARRRADEYAAIHGGVAVWCTPDAWSTDDDHRSHGGYAIDRGGASWDDAAGAAVIDEEI